MKSSDARKPVIHTAEQEDQVRTMVNPVLDVIEEEFGTWGLDCVREFCSGRIEEVSRSTLRPGS